VALLPAHKAGGVRAAACIVVVVVVVVVVVEAVVVAGSVFLGRGDDVFGGD
jgi:hypothetical protein